jgi:catechol 2,3-dioxygenase-like lactoylglutathione lyase family enzyme
MTRDGGKMYVQDRMRIEHVAFQVADPVALAEWYVQHLGLTLKRAFPDPPFGRFLAGDGDAVMLEFYNNPKVAVPDYRQVDPLIVHIAFVVDDVAGTYERLLAAGATAEGVVQVNESGDVMAMLRDPWGLPLQFLRRQSAMI